MQFVKAAFAWQLVALLISELDGGIYVDRDIARCAHHVTASVYYCESIDCEVITLNKKFYLVTMSACDGVARLYGLDTRTDDESWSLGNMRMRMFNPLRAASSRQQFHSGELPIEHLGDNKPSSSLLTRRSRYANYSARFWSVLPGKSYVLSDMFEKPRHRNENSVLGKRVTRTSGNVHTNLREHCMAKCSYFFTRMSKVRPFRDILLSLHAQLWGHVTELK